MNLHFVSADKVVVKDDTSCQTNDQFIGVHPPDLNTNSYDMNSMKRNLIYMLPPRSNLNGQGLNLKTRVITGLF